MPTRQEIQLAAEARDLKVSLDKKLDALLKLINKVKSGRSGMNFTKEEEKWSVMKVNFQSFIDKSHNTSVIEGKEALEMQKFINKFEKSARTVDKFFDDHR